ncbi:type II secretion system F family protein [Eubacterium oxidoreducens]|uniref:Type IV pilus assembly protein PilC n=1 Tax=Eubacterium oxidoreducens TaxID=1732 RepID=A0A1G6BLG5_EUBOX|nr:type II secretion system F family protein [Eubacterium oxidoreducens]SDB21451.1 type IV pilus assembly protein PilC [Eubacterium oxidoreducens]
MAEKQIDYAYVSVFCENVAMMLSGGIVPEEAIGLLMDDSDKNRYYDELKEIQKKLVLGQGMADAVWECDFLPEYAKQMIRIGEQSGRMDKALDALADYYKKQDDIVARLKASVVYPFILLLLMCAVLIVMVSKVLPVFIGVYENLAGTISGSSYAYVSVAIVVGIVALVITIVMAASLLIGMLMYRTAKGRIKISHFLQQSKMTKSASYKMALAQCLQALSTLVASGMNTDEALYHTEKTIVHKQLKERIGLVLEDMKQAHSLAQAFYDRQIIPPLYARMLITGTHSGKIDQALVEVSDTISENAAQEVTGVIDKVEPLLTGFLTAAIGITLLSVMLPLIGILGTIG